MGPPGAVPRLGLSWDRVEALDDEALEQRLFPSEQVWTERRRSVPDWSQIHQELKGKGVTRSLLWQEYRERPPGRLPLQPLLRAVPRPGGRSSR